MSVFEKKITVYITEDHMGMHCVQSNIKLYPANMTWFIIIFACDVLLVNS